MPRTPSPREPGLTDVLTDLLDSLEDPPAAAASTGKRLPFGRAEIQLSYAPLVKDTAPAVVNVYASQQVKAASPFAGDPFFEQFFGGQAPRAGAVRAGFGGHRRPEGLHRHQLPCHSGCRRGEGRDLRRAGIRLQGAAQGRVARSCRSQDRWRCRFPGHPDRRFRRAGGRRSRAGHRQSVRRRPDDDQRHRLGAGALAYRRVGFRLLHPDRRGDQSGQFGRRADQHERAAGRHQHRDLQPQRRFHRHRFRHPVQHGQRRRQGRAKRPGLFRAALYRCEFRARDGRRSRNRSA